MRGPDLGPALARTPIFSACPPAAVQRLAERLTPQVFRGGESIFLHGDASDAMYLVLEGLLKVTISSLSGEEMLLAAIRAGDTFGELGTLDHRPRSATVTAVTNAELIKVEHAALVELFEASPDAVEGIIAALAGLIRRLTDQTADFAFLDLHGRVAKLIIRLAEVDTEPVVDGTRLDLPLTQKELAEMVGGSRQSVNEILHSFSRRGFLRLEDRQLVILDAASLRRRAGLER